MPTGYAASSLKMLRQRVESRATRHKIGKRSLAVWFEVDLFACVKPFVPKPGGLAVDRANHDGNGGCDLLLCRDCCDRSLARDVQRARPCTWRSRLSCTFRDTRRRWTLGTVGGHESSAESYGG